MGVEPPREVGGRAVPTGHDRLSQPREVLLKRLEDGVAVAGGHRLPVDRRVAQVGHGAEHVERLTSGWGHTRVGDRGGVEIKAEVGGQAMAVENVSQQPLKPRREQDRVVGQVRIPTVGAEVQHE